MEARPHAQLIWPKTWSDGTGPGMHSTFRLEALRPGSQRCLWSLLWLAGTGVCVTSSLSLEAQETDKSPISTAEVPLPFAYNYGETDTTRSGGMSGALRAAGNGTTAIFVNPAGMTLTRVYHIEAIGQIDRVRRADDDERQQQQGKDPHVLNDGIFHRGEVELADVVGGGRQKVEITDGEAGDGKLEDELDAAADSLRSARPLLRPFLNPLTGTCSHVSAHRRPHRHHLGHHGGIGEAGEKQDDEQGEDPCRQAGGAPGVLHKAWRMAARRSSAGAP